MTLGFAEISDDEKSKENLIPTREQRERERERVSLKENNGVDFIVSKFSGQLYPSQGRAVEHSRQPRPRLAESCY